MASKTYESPPALLIGGDAISRLTQGKVAPQPFLDVATPTVAPIGVDSDNSRLLLLEEEGVAAYSLAGPTSSRHLLIRSSAQGCGFAWTLRWDGPTHRVVALEVLQRCGVVRIVHEDGAIDSVPVVPGPGVSVGFRPDRICTPSADGRGVVVVDFSGKILWKTALPFQAVGTVLGDGSPDHVLVESLSRGLFILRRGERWRRVDRAGAGACFSSSPGLAWYVRAGTEIRRLKFSDGVLSDSVLSLPGSVTRRGSQSLVGHPLRIVESSCGRFLGAQLKGGTTSSSVQICVYSRIDGAASFQEWPSPVPIAFEPSASDQISI